MKTFSQSRHGFFGIAAMIAMIVMIAMSAALIAPRSEARAQEEELVVVELFTSQGCSSCPAADEVLGELAQNPRILALSLHVDYWNRLGWVDPFSRPEHTARQRAYSALLSGRGIYTPQVVIDGKEETVGSRRRKIKRLTRAAARSPKPLVLTATPGTSGDAGTWRVEISARADEKVPSLASVFLLRFDHEQTTAIKSGENAGREITYTNVVRSIDKLARWQGVPLSVSVPPLTLGQGAALIVQQEPVGPILGTLLLPSGGLTTAAIGVDVGADVGREASFRRPRL